MFSSRLIFIRRCFSDHKLPIYSVYNMENHGSLELAIIVDRPEMTKVENYTEFKLYLPIEKTHTKRRKLQALLFSIGHFCTLSKR